ncbi:MAG: U32 family peptidase [Ruminococcaceae bacterium]|nr:U32 family peptidase [Oscillospiraceae bacterium]
MSDNRKPELLLPAGNPEKLAAALRYGADAVYLAGQRFGMRAAADNFDLSSMAEGVRLANTYGASVYLTVNVMPHGYEYPALRAYLASLSEIGLSGIIAADLGVIALVREILPDIPIHVSTQASIVSAEAAEQYLRLGCRRAVLARELTMEEITAIRRRTSGEMELEVFIHGSMCISWSGRCLLSNHFTGRDANRGACAQPCRWNYHLYEIAEEKRLDQPLSIAETDRGTFIMSSRDLSMIEHIPALIESGIDSFKIEGRMKSAYYTAVTANTYRMAIDRYLADPASYVMDPAWLNELDSVSHREYGTGYFFDALDSDAKTVTMPGYVREKAYIGVVESYDASTGRATVIQRNKVTAGEAVEIISPGHIGRPIVATAFQNENGEPIPSAPHPLMRFSLAVPFPVKAGDILRK